jgi:NADH-quinone oxidoreductase subunit F
MIERPLTQDLREDRQPLNLQAYQHAGGYEALRQAVGRSDPQAVQSLVTASGLRGRGGAGFPTGLKWSFVPMGPTARRPKFFLVNADEMEPGTFKDRLLLESNPHAVVEGAILGAYAIEAEVVYVFLREEYHAARQHVSQAIAEARSAGFLGQNILGSDFGLEMHVHSSAGRYMCGEETGLINALEGKRAVPRSKPPYPQSSGLWGKPTIVNNVETVVNLPHIVRHGADWFKRLSRSKDAGTKIYGVSGRVNRPGLWELPMGTTLREILEEHAGGMQPGYRLRGVIPGGASTDFLTADHLDVAMDFDGVKAAGSRLGTGTMIVLDDRTCPVAMLHNLETFFARESCGWCTPCRDGLPWAAKILGAIEEGCGEERDLDMLEHLCRMAAPGHTFCALAPGAVEPLQSGLRYFREDFLEHIRRKACPWR